MEQEPQPSLNVLGTGSVGVGRDVRDSTIVTNIYLGGASRAGPEPPQRLADIRFPPLREKFAGRVALLDGLAQVLQPGKAAGLSQQAAVKADGGYGKTALAVELGWRLYEQGHFDYVLFLNASSPEALDNDLASLCARDKLNLPEQLATEQAARLAGVAAWLKMPANAHRTLLILDGADSPGAREAVRRWRPLVPGCALLVTSREIIGGGIAAHELDLFTREEAREFLRARIAPAHRREAEGEATLDGLAQAVDHLPLALEIVASYLRESHQSPQEWLEEWRAAPAGTLEHRSPEDTPYPVSLSRVWEQSVSRLSPEARAQLDSFAWLAPRPAGFPVGSLRKRDDWPERRKGYGALEKASLLQWPQERDEITIHRVLQAVMRHRRTIDETAASLALAIATLEASIPGPEFDVEGWHLWELLAPHLQALLGHLQGRAEESTAAFLISKYALWLHYRAQHAEAEPLMKRALEIDEKSLGREHPRVAMQLNNLAELLRDTNRLAEAEPMMMRALEIDEKSLGAEHPNIATRLNNLASLLLDTNRLAEAEPMMMRALAIGEKSFGAEHPRVAILLNNLARLLQDTNRLAEAEPMMKRALAIDEKSFGPEHPNVARGLNNLAQLLQATSRLAEAEPLMRQALAIDEKSLGAEHPNVATRLNNLALLLQATNRRPEAEPLYKRALAIDEKCLGAEHPNVANRLNNLARLLQVTNRRPEAESLFKRALAIDEKSFGPEHPNVAMRLCNLARLLQDTNRRPEAEPLFKRALAIDEKSFGAGHPSVARDLNNLAMLLLGTNRLAEAEPLMKRALEIFLRSQFQAGHPLSEVRVVEGNYRRLLEARQWTEGRINEHIADVTQEVRTAVARGR